MKKTTELTSLARVAYVAYIQKLQPPPGHVGHPTFEGLPKSVREAWERSAMAMYNVITNAIAQEVEDIKARQTATPLQ